MIKVWAPFAERVSLQLRDASDSMNPSGGGWWQTGKDYPAGTDYYFVLDRGKPLPDPRSCWQPEGVHGASRIVNHDSFKWTDQDWRPPPLGGAVFYEIHIGTFTPAGTFQAARGKLGYLKDLGITHLEFMPVNEFSGSRGWGYDGVDIYAPHHHYGCPEDLKKLVDDSHRAGLAVVLDVVYNHLGPSGNYLSRFGPYFTDRYETPWGAAVNLDGEYSDEVRRFFCDNALMWLRDYHFDGLRLDAVHAIYDFSAVHFLEQLASEVDELSHLLQKSLVLVAESDKNDPRYVRPACCGGYGMDAQWSDDFHHALHAVLTGERSGYYADFGDLRQLAKALAAGYVFDGCRSKFRNRRHGRPLADVEASRLVCAMQNHDQVGNRAGGERITALVSQKRAKIGAAVVLTAPFVPLLFQGEEWGARSAFCYFSGHEEEALAEAVRRGRRQEFAAFGWDPLQIPDPQDENTFQASKLNWEEREADEHRQLLEWYRALVVLRKNTASLMDGSFRNVRADANEECKTLLMRRKEILVACNFGPAEQEFRLGSNARILLSSDSNTLIRRSSLVVQPESVAVVQTAAQMEA